MKAELEQLIALQRLDLTIRQLQAELDSLPQRRAEIEKEFDQRAFELRALEERRASANVQRTALEAQINEVRSQAERAERNLMQAKNEKDYGAAIREIDAARKLVAQLETQTIEQMEAVETAENELREREPEFTRLKAEMSEKLQAFDDRAQALEAEATARRSERERLMSSLAKGTAALYNRLVTRTRDGVAVAEVRNNSCTSCRMVLRPQMLADVRRGEEIITCDNCSRILYYVPAEGAGQSSPASAT